MNHRARIATVFVEQDVITKAELSANSQYLWDELGRAVNRVDTAGNGLC